MAKGRIELAEEGSGLDREWCDVRTSPWRYAIFVLSILVAGMSRAGAQTSRIPNGGFEASATEIAGWRVFNLVGDGFRASLVDQAHSGTRALRIERDAGGGDAGVDLWDRPLRVLAGEELRLVLAARKVGGDARSRLHVSIHEFSVAGTFLKEGHHVKLFDVPTSEFRALSWEVALVSPQTAFVSVGFRLGDADGRLSHPGAYLIDDVVLQGDVPSLLLHPGPAPAICSDVRDHGAKGDGVTDDTLAFQRALNERHLAGGGVVDVPAGCYLIGQHLLIPSSVTLRGVWEAPPIPARFTPPGDSPKLAGSILLAVEGAGDPDGIPFIRLDANACLRGLTIVYPEQTRTNPPVPYPWTVATVGADNCSIVDVLMLNPYQAVDFGSHPSGRHTIRGLYGDPLYRGLYVDRCLDVGRVENVHFWPFYDTDLSGPLRRFVLENCTAFVIGRTDWQYLTNCFAYGQHIGFHFIRGKGTGAHAGPGNVLMTQSGADMADTAILVDELQGHSGVLASNSQFFGDIVVGERNVGPMRFSNCGFYGSIHGRRGVSQALLAGNGSVAFQNCHFIALHPDNQAPVSILARGGSLSLIGCDFMTSGRAQVVLERAVRCAVVMGNQFAGRMQIENSSAGQVAISANVDDLPAMAEGVILIDDGDTSGRFVETGVWHRAGGPGNVMRTCLWTEPGAPGTQAQWMTDIAETQTYAVEIWYGPDPNNDHATDARFTVHHAEGTDAFRVNLRENTAQWNRLGIFRFEPGKPARVTLSSTANGNLVADAVRLLPAATDP